MFEFVRKHTRLLQLLLLVLILPSFVVFGIQGYSKFLDGANQSVAKVDGQSISQGEWDYGHQQQVERIRRQRPDTDVKAFDTPAARAESLDMLVRDRVVRAAVRDLNLGVSDDRLQRMFVSDPQFAMLRNADGSVNKDLLAAQGMSSEMFAQQLRQDLANQQLMGVIGGSVVAPAAPVDQALDALLQRREIRYDRFELKNYTAKVQPTEVEIAAFYKANEALFRTPEQATIDYVVLDIDLLKKGIAVPEEDLRRYYDENIARFTAAEERRLRHVLIKADKSAPADARQKARARAESVLAEARKSPGAFAELAKKYSEDEGSAQQGGDLDFFGRGAMVKPFEDAAYAMKPGEISNVVETDFGFHVLKLEAVRGGQAQAFDAVRPVIEDEVRKQLATKRWAESAELFTNTVYEQSDSLQPAIDKLKLEKRNAIVQRTPAPGAAGALASPKLLDAVFANDIVRNKRNTDAVEIGPNQLASARVVSYQPASTRPLAEVQDMVRQRLVLQQALALAQKDGQARLAQLKTDPNSGELPLQVTVSRMQPGGLPRPVIEAVLAADAAKLPAAVGSELAGQGYLVARIDKVLPREVKPEDVASFKTQYAQAWARAETDAYYAALKGRFKAEKLARPAASAEGAAPVAKR